MKQIPPYIASILLASLIAFASPAQAGMPFQTKAEAYEGYRRDCDSIALVTMHQVRRTPQDEVERKVLAGWLTSRPHYSFQAKIVETLRGTQLKGPVEIRCNLVPVKEDVSQPLTEDQRVARLEGGKAVMLVRKNRTAKSFNYSVWPVASFHDDKRVRFWRKATALWNLPEAQLRRNALQAGCRDPLPEFQEYCCQRIALWRGKPDQYSDEQLKRAAAYPLIWEQFLNPHTPLEVIAACDAILGRMSPGWRTHPARYDVLSRVVRRHAKAMPPPADAQQDYLLVEPMLQGLSHYPGRERQTFRFLLELIDGDQARRRLQAISHLRHLYRPHARDAQQRELNQEVLDRLSQELRNKDPKRALSAADSISRIVSDFHFLGGLPAQIHALLDAPAEQLAAKSSFRIRSWLKDSRASLAEPSFVAGVVGEKRRAGFTDLTIPGPAQVGKKVVFVAALNAGHEPHDAVFGYRAWTSWAGWNDEPVWLAEPPGWPNAGTGLVVVTGVLEKRNDVPVFDLKPDSPFADGLPVPPEYDAAEIRRRYVIRDVEWQLLEPQANKVPLKDGQKSSDE